MNAVGDGANPLDGEIGRDLTDQARLARLAEEQAALRRVATLVARATSPEEVFAAVAEEAGQLLCVELASLFRYEPNRRATSITTWGPAGKQFPVGRQWPLEGHNVSTLVFETGRRPGSTAMPIVPRARSAQPSDRLASARRSVRRSSSRDVCGG